MINKVGASNISSEEVAAVIEKDDENWNCHR